MFNQFHCLIHLCPALEPTKPVPPHTGTTAVDVNEYNMPLLAIYFGCMTQVNLSRMPTAAKDHEWKSTKTPWHPIYESQGASKSCYSCTLRLVRFNLSLCLRIDYS